MIGRRKMLGLMAGLGIGTAAAGPAFALGECLPMPSETAGPFPANGTRTRGGLAYNALDQAGVIRSDMRTSFGGMTSVAEGVPLEMDLELVSAGADCAPLSGYAIYLWHCDAIGRYSMYDMDDNYLRAVGVAGADGKCLSQRCSQAVTQGVGRMCISKSSRRHLPLCPVPNPY
jgi:protocatechuate 3,4-dioxygenase beta subunit